MAIYLELLVLQDAKSLLELGLVDQKSVKHSQPFAQQNWKHFQLCV